MARAAISGERYDVGRVLGRTFSAIFANWLVLGGFALALSLLATLISEFSVRLGVGGLDYSDPQAAASLFQAPSYWVAVIAGVVINSFLQAGLLHGFIAVEQGGTALFGDCFSAGLKYFLPLLGLTILWMIGVMLGWMLLLVPGLILSTMWSVCLPALVAEGCGVFGAFSRSRALTKGVRWPVFGTLLVFLIVYVMTVAIFTTISAGGLFWFNSLTMIGAPLVSLTSFVLVSLLLTSFLSALYLEVRLVKEGGGSRNLRDIFS